MGSTGMIIMYFATIAVVATLKFMWHSRKNHKRDRVITDNGFGRSHVEMGVLTGQHVPMAARHVPMAAMPVPMAAMPVPPVVKPVPPVATPGGGGPRWSQKTGERYSEKSRFLTEL